jgi:hypothetical protein
LWQAVEAKQKFISQIMTSKAPVRRCEDVDDVVLSYAEIKALCVGNPLIAEKMTLDSEVSKLRMLKSEYRNVRFRLEDNLLKRFPQQSAALKARIAGIEKDIETYAAEKGKSVEVVTKNGVTSVTDKFPGMTISGVIYDKKEDAAKALVEVCKGISVREKELPAGKYMGFDLSLNYSSFGNQVELLIRGAVTYRLDLSSDTFGNITRINNALNKLPERLEGAKSDLVDLNRQIEMSKLELEKPFPQEAELVEKEARLVFLNAGLDVDGKEDSVVAEVINDDERDEDGVDEDEQDINMPGEIGGGDETLSSTSPGGGAAGIFEKLNGVKEKLQKTSRIEVIDQKERLGANAR